MPGDGDVVIRIRFDVDDAGLERARRKLRAFSRDVSQLESRLKKLSGALDDANESTAGYSKATSVAAKDNDRFSESTDRLSRRLQRTNRDFDFGQKAVKGFASLMSTSLKVGLIAASIEFAAVALALSTVNGLFAVGSGLVKAYRWTMSGLSAVTAGVVVGLAAVAAAQREYNAALVAHRYSTQSAFGGGTAQAMMAMRMLTSDTQLAVFGMESLNATFAAVSKNAELTGAMTSALRGVGDFAVAAGGDIGKNITAAGTFIGLLQKEGRVTADVLTAAGEVSTEFQKAVETAQKGGMTTASELMNALSSGILSDQAGIGQALETVNMTLMGRAKAFFTQSVSMFADFGSMYLPEITRAFEQLTGIVRRLFFRMSGDIAGFGVDTFLEKFINLVDRAATGIGDLFGRYLPGANGMLEGLGHSIGQLINWFREFRTTLEGLRDGARVITDTFGPPLIQVFTGLGQSIQALDEIVVEDQDKWRSFGEALTTAVTAIQDSFNAFKEFISENLGLFEGLAGVIETIANAIGGLFRVLAGAGNLNSSLGAILGLGVLGGGAMGLSRLNETLGRSGRAGRVSGVGDFLRSRTTGGGPLGAGGAMQSVAAMTVNAASVTVMGPSAQSGTIVGGGSRATERAARRAGVPYQPTLPGFENAGGTVPVTSNTTVGGTQASRFQRFTGAMRNYAGPTGGLATAGAFVGQAGMLAAGSEPNLLTTIGLPLTLVNPTLGLATTAAGTALGSETLLGGLGSGALAGGLGGSRFGPIGIVIGTIIGGILGGIQGADAENERRRAERRTQAINNNLGNIREYGRLAGMGRSDEARTKIAQELYMNPYGTPEEIFKVADRLFGNLDNNVGRLEQATGKSSAEIVELADSMGVDLTDRVYELGEALELLGLKVPATIEELNSTLRDKTLKAWTDTLNPILEEEAAKNTLNAASERVRQSGGMLNREDSANYLMDSVGALTQMHQDPIMVAEKMIGLYGTQEAPGRAFQEGQALYGIDMGPEFWSQLQAGLSANLSTISQNTGQVLAGFAASIPGLTEGIDAGAVNSALQALAAQDPTAMLNVARELNALATDSAFKDSLTGIDPTQATAAVFAELERRGLSAPVGTGAPPAQATPSTSAESLGMSEEDFGRIKGALTQGIVDGAAQLPKLELASNSVYIRNASAVEAAVKRGLGGGDTTTSRLASTMTRHGMYDSMFAGKRTVTSSLRNYNLGSLGSDHATGNAYDLVGQNLVGYASMVNRTGGFAEFHGSGSDRHLHVVPGMPMGDAVAPAPMPVVATGGGPVSNSYNFQIYAAEGQDPNAIANAVMAKIDARDRDARERA